MKTLTGWELKKNQKFKIVCLHLQGGCAIFVHFHRINNTQTEVVLYGSSQSKYPVANLTLPY